nr:unnamed protein product [Digitaria exilis]
MMTWSTKESDRACAYPIVIYSILISGELSHRPRASRHVVEAEPSCVGVAIILSPELEPDPRPPNQFVDHDSPGERCDNLGLFGGSRLWIHALLPACYGSGRAVFHRSREPEATKEWGLRRSPPCSRATREGGSAPAGNGKPRQHRGTRPASHTDAAPPPRRSRGRAPMPAPQPPGAATRRNQPIWRRRRPSSLIAPIASVSARWAAGSRQVDDDVLHGGKEPLILFQTTLAPQGAPPALAPPPVTDPCSPSLQPPSKPRSSSTPSTCGEIEMAPATSHRTDLMSPPPATAPAPTATTATPKPRPTSEAPLPFLSPWAAPLLPSTGRSKLRRWKEPNEDSDDDDLLQMEAPTYRDATIRELQQAVPGDAGQGPSNRVTIQPSPTPSPSRRVSPDSAGREAEARARTVLRHAEVRLTAEAWTRSGRPAPQSSSSMGCRFAGATTALRPDAMGAAVLPCTSASGGASPRQTQTGGSTPPDANRDRRARGRLHPGLSPRHSPESPPARGLQDAYPLPAVSDCKRRRQPKRARGDFGDENIRPRRFTGVRQSNPGTLRSHDAITPDPSRRPDCPISGDAREPMVIDNSDGLPPSHPSLRPRELPCFFDRDDNIHGEEARLRLALIQVGSTAPVTMDDAQRAVEAIDGVVANDVRIVAASFLVVCSTQAARDAIFRAGIVHLPCVADASPLAVSPSTSPSPTTFDGAGGGVAHDQRHVAWELADGHVTNGQVDRPAAKLLTHKGKATKESNDEVDNPIPTPSKADKDHAEAVVLCSGRDNGQTTSSMADPVNTAPHQEPRMDATRDSGIDQAPELLLIESELPAVGTMQLDPAQLAAVDEPASADTLQLDQFSELITKRISTPLLPKATRNMVPAPPPLPSSRSNAAKPMRNSSRLANSKLAKIPVARRGEVLLMRRFDLATAEQGGQATGTVDCVFDNGVPRGHAEKVMDMFPLRRADMGLLSEAVVDLVFEVVHGRMLKEVLCQLGSAAGEQIKARWKLKEDMESIKSTLELVQAVLRDAERRSVREEAVNLWLKMLKNAAYDVSDMLDEFEAQLSQVKKYFSLQPRLADTFAAVGQTLRAKEIIGFILDHRFGWAEADRTLLCGEEFGPLTDANATDCRTLRAARSVTKRLNRRRISTDILDWWLELRHGHNGLKQRGIDSMVQLIT